METQEGDVVEYQLKRMMSENTIRIITALDSMGMGKAGILGLFAAGYDEVAKAKGSIKKEVDCQTKLEELEKQMCDADTEHTKSVESLVSLIRQQKKEIHKNSCYITELLDKIERLEKEKG